MTDCIYLFLIVYVQALVDDELGCFLVWQKLGGSGQVLQIASLLS